MCKRGYIKVFVSPIECLSASFLKRVFFVINLKNECFFFRKMKGLLYWLDNMNVTAKFVTRKSEGKFHHDVFLPPGEPSLSQEIIKNQKKVNEATYEQQYSGSPESNAYRVVSKIQYSVKRGINFYDVVRGL